MAGVFLLSDPIEMTPFVPGDFSQVLGQIQAGEDDRILQDQIERLQKTIADLGITGFCRGVVQPSDMTVEMKDYYASGGNAAAHQVSVSIGCRLRDCNNPPGLLRVHVLWTAEVHPTLGAIPPFSSG